MSDTTRRLAEVCERQAALLQAHAELSIKFVRTATTINAALAQESYGYEAAGDAASLRALAAALRGAKQIVTHEGNTLTALELETT